MSDKIADTHLPIVVNKRTVEFDGFRKLLSYDYLEEGQDVEVHRELVDGKHGVAVVIQDPILEKMVMIRQFRLGAQIGTGLGMTVEIVAGLIDGDETADQAAMREVKEETGLEPVRLERLCQFLTSPGLTSETITLFYAEADASNLPEISGHEAESEQTFPFLLSFEEAMDATDHNDICNGIVMLGLLWFARHRKKLAG